MILLVACLQEGKLGGITEINLQRTPNYIVHEPDRTSLVGILVAVDLLLLESPLGQKLCVRPQGYLCGYVDKSEMSTLALPGSSRVTIIKTEMEKSIIVAGMVVLGPCREFFICWHQRRCNIVSQEERLSTDMQ